MSDAEERAKAIVDAVNNAFLTWSTCDLEGMITTAIREAVAAETQRCAVVAGEIERDARVDMDKAIVEREREVVLEWIAGRVTAAETVKDALVIRARGAKP